MRFILNGSSLRESHKATMKFSTFVTRFPCDNWGGGSKTGKNLTNFSRVEGVDDSESLAAHFAGRTARCTGMVGHLAISEMDIKYGAP